jgi:thiamine biosynthesis lipoprotein
MTSSPREGYAVQNAGAHWVVTYTAMASPCEVLVPCDNASEADKLASLACVETLRIEHKFSRYRDDNIIHAINHSDGAAVQVDEETSRLLRYAGQCYELSDGRFDITSGILRRAWTFDGRAATPDDALIESLRARVGWERVVFDGAAIRLLPGMEIDLGGIGKEYAADRVAAIVAEAAAGPVMVNLGGDIRVTGHGSARRTWTIGIEEPGRDNTAIGQVELSDGAVATSGDSRRFCTVGGVRLGHILDPRTGWPVEGAPRSATVIADTCTAAGFLATMAMLHGTEAEAFLAAQQVVYHCIR